MVFDHLHRERKNLHHLNPMGFVYPNHQQPECADDSHPYLLVTGTIPVIKISLLTSDVSQDMSVDQLYYMERVHDADSIGKVL
jgi:hypothetical protein